MENIDKLRELQDFNFHGNLDVKHILKRRLKKHTQKKVTRKENITKFATVLVIK